MVSSNFFQISSHDVLVHLSIGLRIFSLINNCCRIFKLDLTIGAVFLFFFYQLYPLAKFLGLDSKIIVCVVVLWYYLRFIHVCRYTYRHKVSFYYLEANFDQISMSCIHAGNTVRGKLRFPLVIIKTHLLFLFGSIEISLNEVPLKNNCLIPHFEIGR